MFGTIAQILQRIFWVGGGHVPTEAYQRAILTHISMQGSARLEEIAAHSFPQVDTAMRENGIVEAAQILVNRGEIAARRGGAAVDPVTVGIAELDVGPPTHGRG